MFFPYVTKARYKFSFVNVLLLLSLVFEQVYRISILNKITYKLSQVIKIDWFDLSSKHIFISSLSNKQDSTYHHIIVNRLFTNIIKHTHTHTYTQHTHTLKSKSLNSFINKVQNVL